MSFFESSPYAHASVSSSLNSYLDHTNTVILIMSGTPPTHSEFNSGDYISSKYASDGTWGSQILVRFNGNGSVWSSGDIGGFVEGRHSAYTNNIILTEAEGTGVATWFLICNTQSNPSSTYYRCAMMGEVGEYGDGKELEMVDTNIITGNKYQFGSLTIQPPYRFEW